MKILISSLLKLFAVVLLQIISVSVVSACLRGTVTSAKKNFDRSENVFVAKLKFSPSEYADKKDKAKLEPNKLKIEKVYKGNFSVGEELEFEGFILGGCAFPFDDTGKEYLLYLYNISKQSKFLQVVPASTSAPLKDSYIDILYLEKEEKVRDKNRLSGILSFDKKTISENKNMSLPSLANRKIYIVGENGSFTAETNERGIYEIYDLPAGRYSIYTEQISGWVTEEGLDKFDEIEIGSSDHVQKSFRFLK